MKHMARVAAWTLLGLGAAVLTACGGGSGGGGAGVDVAKLGQTAASAPAATTGGSETRAAQESKPAQASSAPTALIEEKISTGPSTAEVSPLRSRPAQDAPSARSILLPALAAAQRPGVQKSAGAQLGVPVKVGQARSVDATATASSTAELLKWTPSSRGGKVTALRFVSSGALGVRVGLLVKSLPIGSIVRFYADGSGQVYEIPAQEVLSTIDRNLAAGDSGDPAHTYWSPNLGGEAISVEVEVPPNTDTGNVQFSVPTLSHVTVDIRDLKSIQKVGEAGSCNFDVSCDLSVAQLSKSVALMDFIADGTGGTTAGSAYVCTGTLMNDRMSSGIPYFLSANHCIPTQTVASSLYTLWSYKSASCGSTQLSTLSSLMTSGAALLYASGSTDTSFMRLNGQPPAGAVYAGSSTIALDPAASVYDVHHPEGDYQKVSSGTFQGYASCTTGGCLASSSATNSNFLRVRWWSGTTEPGSSGSGLFTRLNGKDYLVGQLYGGSASCSNILGNDYFGRFDVAFNSALSQWLGASSPTLRVPVYRLYNTNTGTHFYTIDPAERDWAVQKIRELTYEGVAFYAFGVPGTATNAVYRFYNREKGVHFYTISQAERDQVIATLPQFTFEGVAWYANTAPGSAATQMYRFYNREKGVHFYTISPAERDQVISTLPQFSYEGVGYYAWTF